MTSFSLASIVLYAGDMNSKIETYFTEIPTYITRIYCVTPGKTERESSDPRVMFIQDLMKGPEEAINLALSYVREDFVVLLFPDDKVDLNIADLPTQENVLVYNQMYSVTETGTKSPKFDKWILRKICMPQVNLIGAYIPVKKLKEIGGFPTLLQVANDHLLILKLERAGVRFRKAREQKTYFTKGGISTKYFEVGLAESATLVGYPLRILGIILGLILVIKNQGNIATYLKQIRKCNENSTHYWH